MREPALLGEVGERGTPPASTPARLAHLPCLPMTSSPSSGFGSVRDVVVSRIWQHPRRGIFHDLVFQDLAFSRIWHSLGCGSLPVVAVPGIWPFPGFGRRKRDLPGSGFWQDVAVTRMWQPPGMGTLQVLTVASIGVVRRRKGSVGAGAKSWLLLGKKSV